MAAQDVHMGHLGRRGKVVRDMSDALRGIVRRQQERDQQAHGLRAHANGVVAVHMDAQKPQALVSGGGDGVHAHDDQVSAEIQGGAVLAHPGHGQGLGADPFELVQDQRFQLAVFQFSDPHLSQSNSVCSSITGMPSCWALVSLLPAASPAST